MLSGTMSCGELCQPAPSRISRAMALTLTHWLISARCLFMAPERRAEVAGARCCLAQ
jgi:hypothetical protein